MLVITENYNSHIRAFEADAGSSDRWENDVTAAATTASTAEFACPHQRHYFHLLPSQYCGSMHCKYGVRAQGLSKRN